MVKVSDIVKHVESLVGRELRGGEGVLHGSADATVTGAVVCWMPSPEAIDDAARRGAELVIVHEGLRFPDAFAERRGTPDQSPTWIPNRQRLSLLDQHGLTVLCTHGSADQISIFDDFAAALGLGKPVHEERVFYKVYEIEPRPLGELIEHVKVRMGMAHVRVAGADDLTRRVHRVGLPWGGYGLFVNVSYVDRLMQLGCDVLIAGEADNYGFRFAAECGIPMIETSHEVSENPGLCHFTQILAEAFPDVQFHFHENACAWQWF